MTTALPLLDAAAFRAGWHAAPAASRDTFARALSDACRDSGFFYLTGHGVMPQTIAAMRDAVVALFALPEQQKRLLTIEPDNYRGYVPLGFFTPNDGRGGAEHYEAYKLHFEAAADDPVCTENALYGPNRWPP